MQQRQPMPTEADTALRLFVNGLAAASPSSRLPLSEAKATQRALRALVQPMPRCRSRGPAPASNGATPEAAEALAGTP